MSDHDYNFMYCTEIPLIYENPQNATALVNDSVTFICSAFGDSSPIITWYKQHTGDTLQLVTAIGGYAISSNNSGQQNATSQLTIHMVMQSDTGVFVCEAASNGAIATSTATLTIIGKKQSDLSWCGMVNYYFNSQFLEASL